MIESASVDIIHIGIVLIILSSSWAWRPRFARPPAHVPVTLASAASMDGECNHYFLISLGSRPRSAQDSVGSVGAHLAPLGKVSVLTSSYLAPLRIVLGQ